MVLLFTYGLMSNLDVDTGHLRWMGEARLTYGAIKEILKGSAYGCRVAYLPADAAQEGADGGGAQVRRSVALRMHLPACMRASGAGKHA